MKLVSTILDLFIPDGFIRIGASVEGLPKRESGGQPDVCSKEIGSSHRPRGNN